MEKQRIQKYRNKLVTAGIALIVFGAMNVFNGVTSLLYMSSDVKALFELIDPEMYIYFRILIVIFTFLFYSIDIGIRVLIGLRAMREGRKLPGSHRYFKLCIFMCILYFVTMILLIRDSLQSGMSYSFVLELFSNIISIYILADIMFLTGKVRDCH